jgi:hypothetical protein
MLTMSVFGFGISIARGVAPAINVPVALLTEHLIVTALITVRPAAAVKRTRHIALMLVAVAVGLTDLTFALQAFASGGKRDGVHAFPFVLFAVMSRSAFARCWLFRSWQSSSRCSIGSGEYAGEVRLAHRGVNAPAVA